MSSDEDLKERIVVFGIRDESDAIENDPAENPELYSPGYSLTQPEVLLAIDTQVAKRTESSLVNASAKYSISTANLDNEYQESIGDELGEFIGDSSKPLVYLVKCQAGKDQTQGDHWLPVILHKEGEEYKIDVINSESEWNHEKIQEFVTSLKGELESKIEGAKVEPVYHERHVQYDNACGLSCADAVGIAVNAIESKRDIASVLANAPDQKAKADSKKAKEEYTQQGQNFFKLVKHLKGLEGENLDKALKAEFLELSSLTSTPSNPLPKIKLSEEEKENAQIKLIIIVKKAVRKQGASATRHGEVDVESEFLKDPNKYIAIALNGERSDAGDLEATLKYMENLYRERENKTIEITAENRQLIEKKLGSLDWLAVKEDKAPAASLAAAATHPPSAAASKEGKEPVLVCIDFDFTAVDGHTHATLANAPGFRAQHASSKAARFTGVVSPEREEEINRALGESENELKPNQVREGFIESVIDMIEDGQKVAITSFSDYPDAIQVALKSKLEAELKSRNLDAELLEENFVIVAGNPRDKSNGKLDHMEEARKHFDLPENCKKMLVEDDGENCLSSKLPKNTVAINIGIGNTTRDKIGKEVPIQFWQDKVVQTSRALYAPPEMPPRSLPTEEHLTINEQEVKEALYAIALESEGKRPKVKIEGGKAMLEFGSESDAKNFRKAKAISETTIFAKGSGPDEFAKKPDDHNVFLKKQDQLKGKNKEEIQSLISEQTGLTPEVKIYENGIIELTFSRLADAQSFTEVLPELGTPIESYEVGEVPEEIQLKKSAKHIFLEEAALTELDDKVESIDKENLLERILETQAKIDGGHQTDESKKEVQLAITLLQEGTRLTENAKRSLALQNTQEITADALYETTHARIEYLKELKGKLSSSPGDEKLSQEIEKITGFISEDIVLFAKHDKIKKSTRLQEMATHQDEDGNTIAHLLAANGEIKLAEQIEYAVDAVGTFENKSGQKIYDIKKNYKDADRAKGYDKLREQAFNLAQEGKDKELKALLEGPEKRGVNLTQILGQTDASGNYIPHLYADSKNILHLAAEFGLTESASYILSKKPKLIAAKDASGQTPIYIAFDAYSDMNQVFDAFLPHANAMEEKLFNAVSQGESYQALDAMNKGANPAEMHPGKFDNGQNLLHLAAANSPKIGSGVIQRIIDSGIDVNSTDINGDTAAHIVARSSYGKEADKVVAIMQALSEAGADLRQPNSNGLTTLDILEEINGKEAAQKFTLEASNILLQSPDLETATEAMRVGGDVNHQDENGKTPLMHALESGNTDLAKLLMENGADLAATTQDGQNALHFAAAKGEKAIASVTLSDAWGKLSSSQKSRLVNAHGGADKATPLHRAADDYNIRDLRYRGAYVDALDANGKAPIETINPEIAFNLLRPYEGKPGSKSKYLRTGIENPENKDEALKNAVLSGEIDNIGIAVAEGASVQTRPDPKTPLLHYALTEEGIPNRDQVVASLVSLGANVNEVNSEGKTPLMLAIENGYLDSAEALLKSPEIDVRKRATHKAKIMETDSGRSETFGKERTITQMAKAELALYEKWSKRRESRSESKEKTLKGKTAFTSADKREKRAGKAASMEKKLKAAKTKVESLQAIVKTLEAKDNEAKLAHLASIGRNESEIRESRGTRSTVRQLLKNHPETNLEPALFAAAQNGKPKALSILLAHHHGKRSKPPLADMRNPQGQNLFEVAKEKGFKESMKVIAQAHQGAAEEPLVSREMINELLLSKDSTAKSIIKRIGEKTPSAINAKDPKTGNTLLQDAILAGNTKAVEKLLTMPNVDIVSPNKKGKTALHLASELGDKKLVKAIMDRAKKQYTKPLDLKAFVEATDKFGRSAIHLAAKADATKSKEDKAKKGSKEIFKLLLEDSHAEPTKRDYLGNRPIDYADRFDHSRAVEGLKEYGSPDITGATLIEEALMKGERSRLDRMRGKGNQIEEATKLFEKFNSKELFPERYSEDGPKFMAMAAENGRSELLARLSQDPYLREEDGKITNKEDLLEAARIAAMSGNDKAIEIMREAILDDSMTIISQKSRLALEKEFTQTVEDAQEKIEKERQREAEIARAKQRRYGKARSMSDAMSAEPTSRVRSGSMTEARSLAQSAAAARGTLKPHEPMGGEDREFTPETKEKFLQFVRDGFDDVDKRTAVQNSKVVKESSDLISDLMDSGKVRNCGKEIDRAKGERKIFDVDLAENRGKTVFFPKFDSNGDQIMSDGKPVVDMIVISKEGQIIAGTLTNPIGESSMPDDFIKQVKAINAPAKSLAAARAAGPKPEKSTTLQHDEQEVQIVWHRARAVSQSLIDVNQLSNDMRDYMKTPEKQQEGIDILDAMMLNIAMTSEGKIDNMQKMANGQAPQFDEETFNKFLASSKPTSLPEGINEAGILQEIEKRKREFYSKRDELQSRLRNDLEAKHELGTVSQARAAAAAPAEPHSEAGSESLTSDELAARMDAGLATLPAAPAASPSSTPPPAASPGDRTLNLAGQLSGASIEVPRGGGDDMQLQEILEQRRKELEQKKGVVHDETTVAAKLQERLARSTHRKPLGENTQQDGLKYKTPGQRATNPGKENLKPGKNTPPLPS